MSDSFITIRSYDTASAAEVDRLVLEDAAIPTILANAETVTTNWLWGNAVGYVQLQVPVEHVERAKELLSAPAREAGRTATIAAGDEEHEVPANARCLACGSKMTEDMDTCPHCGWSFHKVETEPEADDEHTSLPHGLLAIFALVMLILFFLFVWNFAGGWLGIRRGA